MASKFSVEAIFTATDRMSAPLTAMSSRLNRFTLGASGGLAKLSGALGSVHRGMVLTAGAAGAAAVAGAGGLFALSRAALTVEDSLAKVGTVITPAMGSVQSALDETKVAALEWSKRHVQSVEDFLAANYNMSSAGLNSTQALAGTRAALTLATATMGDATTAGNLLATVYNNLGDKARNADAEMNRLSDVLAKTQALFQIADLSQLNEGLKMGAPSAIQYGQSIEELSTMIGALNTAGLQGSMAGTAYSAAMRQMGKASKALHFEMARTADGGIDFIGTIGALEKKFGSFEKMTDKQKAAFQQAFGDEGVRAIALMMGKHDELVVSLDKVTNATGAAAAAQATIEAARGQKLAIFGNQLRASMIAFGDAILPVMDELRPEIDKVIEGIGAWTAANKGLVASKIVGFVRGVRDNLPEIVTWLERIGTAALVFYGFAAAVKVAQAAMVAYRAVVVTVAGAKAALAYVTTAGTLGNNVYTASLATMRVAAISAGHGLGVMRTSLNATALAGSINGVTSLLGKAGLLGAALGVGYALGTWLDHTFGFSKMLTDVIAKMTGLDDDLNKDGKRFNTRAEANAKFLPAEPRGFNAATAGGGGGFDMVADGESRNPTGVSPVVVSQEQRIARAISESTTTEKVELTLRAEPGTSAEITKKPSGGSRTKLDMPASGRPR